MSSFVKSDGLRRELRSILKGPMRPLLWVVAGVWDDSWSRFVCPEVEGPGFGSLVAKEANRFMVSTVGGVEGGGGMNPLVTSVNPPDKRNFLEDLSGDGSKGRLKALPGFARISDGSGTFSDVSISESISSMVSSGSGRSRASSRKRRLLSRSALLKALRLILRIFGTVGVLQRANNQLSVGIGPILGAQGRRRPIAASTASRT